MVTRDRDRSLARGQAEVRVGAEEAGGEQYRAEGCVQPQTGPREAFEEKQRHDRAEARLAGEGEGESGAAVSQ